MPCGGVRGMVWRLKKSNMGGQSTQAAPGAAQAAAGAVVPGVAPAAAPGGGAVVAGAAIVAAGYFLRKKKEGWAFGMTAVTIIFSVATIFLVLFPRLCSLSSFIKVGRTGSSANAFRLTQNRLHTKTVTALA
mgnify:CR=1 FL=1